jgi:hypothetical protein
MNLSTMRARVRNAVKDLDASAYYWTNDEVDAAIVAALGEWTAACPDCAHVEKDGDGSTREFDLSAETGYLFCLAVEHPIGEDPPKLLGFREHSHGAVVIRGDAPTAGMANVRFWYAKAYDSAAGAWTLPSEDEQAIEVGAAAKLTDAGSVYASGRINASADRSSWLRKAGDSWRQDFQARLSKARLRQVGPQWWVSWRLSDET